MNDSAGYAVFFFPPALEALGDAIKPYLQEGPGGVHVPCREIDTGGAFVEMTLQGRTNDGRDVDVEMMVPTAMVRMIVSARSDAEFGFYDRSRSAHLLAVPGLLSPNNPEETAETVAPQPVTTAQADKPPGASESSKPST